MAEGSTIRETTGEGSSERSDPCIVVLGTAQDGGRPHIGVRDPEAFARPTEFRSAACVALVDPVDDFRLLLEATPDIKRQLHRLEQIAGPRTDRRRPVDALAITHGHVGHYLGLAWLGREMLDVRDLPVCVMPKMRRFIEGNLPWQALVERGNIRLEELAADRPHPIGTRCSITPIPVPHRDEHTETVAFRIAGPDRSILFLPDIDSWEKLDATGRTIEELIASVDVALLDGTFLDPDEIGSRSSVDVPHPPIRHTLERLSALPERERSKVRFIHLNHTNPAESHGLPVAEEGEIIGL